MGCRHKQAPLCSSIVTHDAAFLAPHHPADATSALVEMMSGDVSLLSDDSLSSLFLALTEASRSPQAMQAIQTVSGSSPAPTPGTDAAVTSSTPASSGSSSGSEAALMGDLFSALFTGADSPISTFLSAAGDGGVSSQLAALLGPSSSAAASVASTAGIPTLRSSLGSLLGTTSTGGATSSSNPFSALLQPAASTRSIMSQLAEAVEQANSVLAAPHWDDLFGGEKPGDTLLTVPAAGASVLRQCNAQAAQLQMKQPESTKHYRPAPLQASTLPDSSAPTAPCSEKQWWRWRCVTCWLCVEWWAVCP